MRGAVERLHGLRVTAVAKDVGERASAGGRCWKLYFIGSDKLILQIRPQLPCATPSVEQLVQSLIPPSGITTTFNGVKLTAGYTYN